MRRHPLLIKVDLGARLLYLLPLGLVLVLSVVRSLILCYLMPLLFIEHLIGHERDRLGVLVESLLRRMRLGLVHEGVLLVALLEIIHLLVGRVRVQHVDDDAAVGLGAVVLVRRGLCGVSLAGLRSCDVCNQGAVVLVFAGLADEDAAGVVVEAGTALELLLAGSCGDGQRGLLVLDQRLAVR